MTTTLFTKNNKKIVKKVSKTMKKNPNATVAIAATAGTGFLGLGVLNVVQHMRNRKLVKAAKAMDEAQASSANANDTQHPEQEPQEEPTNETSTTAATNTADTTATDEPASPVNSINPEILQAAFNEFNCVRNDPRSQGWSDEQIASTVAQRFAADPNGIGYIYTYILNLVARINFQQLQAAVMRTNSTTQPHEPEVFDEPEETADNETNDTNPDEGKYPASSKKQQKNGSKGNNKKN